MDGWRALACEILHRAFLDTKSRGGEKAARDACIPAGVSLADDARSFLHSDGGRWLWLMLELDGSLFDEALAGVPRVDFEQLTFLE